jgi:hypothetical protein
MALIFLGNSDEGHKKLPLLTVFQARILAHIKIDFESFKETNLETGYFDRDSFLKSDCHCKLNREEVNKK